MEIEVFENKAIETNSLEVNEEISELISDLDLEGQKQFIEEDNKEDTLFPFRKLSDSELFTYSVLLPRQVKFSKYKESLYPKEILYVASRVKNYLTHLNIRFDPNKPENMVFFYGTTMEYAYQKGYEQYLLARWGTGLENYEYLEEMAVNKWRDKAEKNISDLLRTIKVGTVQQILSASPDWSPSQPWY